MRPSNLHTARLTLAVLAALCAADASAQVQTREQWYAAAYDHVDTGLTVLIVTGDDRRRWIRISDLRLLDVPVPDAPSRLHQGERFVPLELVGRSMVDDVEQRLHLFRSSAPSEFEAAEELIVDVVVNQHSLVEPQIIRRAGAGIWLSRATLEAARLVAPDSADDSDWVALQDLVGEHYLLDEDDLRLRLNAAPERFVPTRLSVDGSRDPRPAPTRAPMAAILGYDFVANHNEGGTRASLLLDAAVSRENGTCSSQHAWRQGRGWSRLDTRCVLDWPARRLSMVLGDGVSRSWAMGGSVRYGGVRIGTDFALEPQFQTQPLLGIEGSARLPSMLEVWVDQQLALKTEVPPGAFLVEGLPSISGSGHVDAVVTDALGRREVISAPFYSDPRLLRRGLDDWSIEAGRTRTGFLTRHDRYADDFVAATWRRGMSDYWTTELRGEWQRDAHVLGIANQIRLGRLGVVDLSASTSQRGADRGTSHALGYTYQGHRWTFGGRYRWTQSGYTDLAYPVLGTAPSRDAQFNAGVRLGKLLVSAGGVMRQSGASGRQRFGRFGVSFPVGPGYLSLSRFDAFDQGDGPRYTASFTLPLSGERSLSAWAGAQNGEFHPGLSLQRSAPVGLGLGYQIGSQRDERGSRSSVAASWRNNSMLATGSVVAQGSNESAQATVSGALLGTSDGVFATNDQDRSFAFVQLPEAGVRVYHEHQLVATTDDQGRAIVPALRPFERNRLAVETDDLEMSTRIANAATTVVPGRRQVLRADFRADRIVPLTLRLLQADGSVVPAGAVATLPGSDLSFPVGHDGLLYLELDGPADTIEAAWPGQRCTFSLVGVAEADDPSILPELTCRISDARAH